MNETDDLMCQEIQDDQSTGLSEVLDPGSVRGCQLFMSCRDVQLKQIVNLISLKRRMDQLKLRHKAVIIDRLSE
jgi:hypothetical protein